MTTSAELPTAPDQKGHFGRFGGRFVPEALMATLDELDDAYRKAKADPSFAAELATLHAEYTGRPSIITEVPQFAAHAGGATIVLKREDLNHTGSHKINNVLGQALLTKRMGKKRVIAETGAGQHGVATATAAALFGLECVVYMGEEDTKRQALNVARMKLLGATVVPVTIGSRTLKDAINEAMRDWVANTDTTHYLLGTVAGPAPFPEMVRDFHRIIGVEARAQVLESMDAYLMWLLPALAAVQMQSASSMNSFRIPRFGFSDLKLQVMVLKPVVMRLQSLVGQLVFCMAIALMFCKTRMAKLSKATQLVPASTTQVLAPNMHTLPT